MKEFKKVPEWLLFLCFFVVLWVICRSKEKATKDALAKYYKISKPTLANWIKYFQNIMSDEVWRKKRFLTLAEYTFLTNEFGHDLSYVLNKNQIATKAESNYPTVKSNVMRNLYKLELSEEAWERSSVFPPKVSMRILEMLG